MMPLIVAMWYPRAEQNFSSIHWFKIERRQHNVQQCSFIQKLKNMSIDTTIASSCMWWYGCWQACWFWPDLSQCQRTNVISQHSGTCTNSSNCSPCTIFRRLQMHCSWCLLPLTPVNIHLTWPRNKLRWLLWHKKWWTFTMSSSHANKKCHFNSQAL